MEATLELGLLARRQLHLVVIDPAANAVVLRGHDGQVSAVAISADGSWLVTGSEDETARLWLLQINDLVDLARSIIGQNFFRDEWQLYFPGEKYRKTFAELPDVAAKRITQKNN